MEDGAINQPSAYAQSHMVEDQGLVLHHRTEKKTPENVKEKLKEHEERVRTDLKGLVHLKMKIVSPSCRSKPVRTSFIFGTQIKMFLMKSESSIDSNTTEMFPGPET